MRNEPCFIGTFVTVGIFRCRPDDPAFEDSGPAEHHSFVFPRTSVWIQHAGQSAFVADPHVVTFYNPGQEYRRRVLDGRGDACEWFAVHPDVLREMTSAIDPGRPTGKRAGSTIRIACPTPGAMSSSGASSAT